MLTEKVGLMKKYKEWNGCTIATFDVSEHDPITLTNDDDPTYVREMVKHIFFFLNKKKGGGVCVCNKNFYSISTTSALHQIVILKHCYYETNFTL